MPVGPGSVTGAGAGAAMATAVNNATMRIVKCVLMCRWLVRTHDVILAEAVAWSTSVRREKRRP